MTVPLRDSLIRRTILAETIARDPKARAAEMELCRRDAARWITNWCWTFDPRLAGDDTRRAWMPFDLFPRQVEMVRWFDHVLASKQDGVLEKSRDIGFTWVFGAWALHKWLFVRGHTTTFGSRKAEYVDVIGDSKSFFERLRMIYRALPPWMMPAGFDPGRHDKSMLLANPANGNTISGESGDSMGRGNRTSIYLIDEAAFIEHADTVDTATLATANCRIWGSTVNGMGNLFARKRHDPALRGDQVFRFHWRDDPRKNEDWANETRRKVEEWKFASEYDIDYSASVEGICVPARWVEASRRLQALLRARGADSVRPSTRGVGGLDVGAGGSGKSVFVPRHGAVVGLPVAWGDPDTIETAHRGISEASATSCAILNYDSVGVGTAVTAVLNRTSPGMTVKGVNVGAPPSEDVWPDGQMAKEKFTNRKAELWSKMRERFKTTYEHVLFLEGDRRGIEHDLTDCIALPEGGGEALTLASQISLPKQIRDERGKVMIEKKSDLARRGISSPDYAEALVLTFDEDDDLAAWAGFGRAMGLPGSWGGM